MFGKSKEREEQIGQRAIVEKERRDKELREMIRQELVIALATQNMPGNRLADEKIAQVRNDLDGRVGAIGELLKDWTDRVKRLEEETLEIDKLRQETTERTDQKIGNLSAVVAQWGDKQQGVTRRIADLGNELSDVRQEFRTSDQSDRQEFIKTDQKLQELREDLDRRSVNYNTRLEHLEHTLAHLTVDHRAYHEKQEQLMKVHQGVMKLMDRLIQILEQVSPAPPTTASKKARKR